MSNDQLERALQSIADEAKTPESRIQPDQLADIAALALDPALTEDEATAKILLNFAMIFDDLTEPDQVEFIRRLIEISKRWNEGQRSRLTKAIERLKNRK